MEAPHWISTKDKLPEELETVWAYNEKYDLIHLACLIYDEGWHWAVSNGTIYTEENNIIAECELDDEYHFDYWMPLPKTPKTLKPCNR